MCQSVNETDLDKYKAEWIAEPKFDGSRCLYINGKFHTIERFSSTPSRDISYKLPEMVHSKQQIVLDGELMAETGKFEDTGSRIHLEDKLGIRIASKKFPVIFWIFDILEIRGNDVRSLPLMQRKELLKSLKFDNERFKIVEWTEDIAGIWERTKEWEKEGIVLKNKNSTYEGKRSWSWLKCKFWKEDVVIVDKYEENPKGLRLEMENGQGLQCAGGQSVEVKQLIDRDGQIKVEIQYLTKDQKAGGKPDEFVYRFPSFKRVYGG